MSSGARLLIGGIVLGAVAAAVWVVRHPSPPAPLATTVPVNLPATAPASPIIPNRSVTSYMDLIHAVRPSFPATQPLVIPVAFASAAHLVFNHPVYVCPRGDLWLTHPDAPPLADQFAGISKEQVHVCREKVRYVHWMLEDGVWSPWIIYQIGDMKGTYLISGSAKAAYNESESPDWSRSISLGELLIAPGRTSVLVWNVRQGQRDIKDLGPDVRLMPSAKGVIAWSESGHAAEFVDGKWSDIGDHLLQPLPLLDGSLLKIIQTGDGAVDLQIDIAASSRVDEKTIADLVEKLSDSNPGVRQKAFTDLQRHGPSIWPMLEKMSDDQPPEAQLRLRQLLKNKQSPTIAGMTLIEKKLQPMIRLNDGGTVLLAPAGVYVATPNKMEPTRVAPAWICLRPGAYVDLLPQSLINDFVAGKTRLIALADEWIVSDAVQGPRRFVGNALIPLVKDAERHFTDPVGIDRRGRWVFRDPKTQQTLVIDPTLPDPTPRLPVWLFTVRKGKTGWDSSDWPCMQSGGTWALHESGWEALDKSIPLQTALPANPVNAVTGSALLIDPEGNRYFDGKTSLRIVRINGSEITWPLPGAAVGTGAPRLFRIADGTLLLINQTGRVLRLRPTPDAKAPFELEATFTRKIPDTDLARRIWMDPAGRLIIAYDENRLAICFPSGLVPPAISNMMPDDDE